MPNSIKEIGEGTFSLCVNLRKVLLPNKINSIGKCMFLLCKKLEEIKLPNNIKEIGKDAFGFCESLKKIYLSNSLEIIDKKAFQGCKKLEEIEMSKNVIYIGESAFISCENLKKIKLSNSLEYIGDYAFEGCISLKEIEIPNSVLNIGKDIFQINGLGEKIDVRIICNKGSYAEQYAIENGIRFKIKEDSNENDIEENLIKENTEQEIIEINIETDTKEKIEKNNIINLDENNIEISEFNLDKCIYVENKLIKQLKDRKLEDDFEKLIVKLNKDLSLNSLGFKKYSGLDVNIYGIDFQNSKRSGDRIIACFLNDYLKQADFDFYESTKEENREILILFSMVEHDRQNDEAIKIANRIMMSLYDEEDIAIYEESIENKEEYVEYSEYNDIFTKVDLVDQKVIYKEVLTKKQAKNIQNFIINQEPFILQGIAGSGKTLSTLNLLPKIDEKLKANNSQNDKILYVTFSNSLKQYVVDIVNSKYDDVKSLEIKTFEELCIDLYKKYKGKQIKREQVVTQHISKNGFWKFLQDLLWEVRDKKFKDFIKNTSKELIYSEIFGLLKGSMYLNWDRKDINLVKKEYYINSGKIIDDYKVFNGEDREYIYQIAEKYNEWLDKKGYHDINDLAFSLIEEVRKTSNYEYVIVDEVQDLTEVQIYLLFLLANNNKLDIVKNTRRIFLAGDPNQIINPTFFKVNRLTTLFHVNGYEWDDAILNENFRNSHKIMDINNTINEIINKKLPARKKEEQEPEILKNNKSGVVALIKYTEENLVNLLKSINGSIKIALVVSNEDKKEELKNKYSYENVFTITEIKGREFDNIVAYNVISDNCDIFEEVYNKEKVKEGHYSYYFNMFYVAITRANYNLVLIEEKETQFLNEIKESLQDEIDYIEVLSDIEQLNLGELDGTSQEALTLGLSFLHDEEFETAKRYFAMSKEKEAEKYLLACDLILELENPSDLDKANVFLELEEYKLAQDYLGKAQEHELYAVIYLYRDDIADGDKKFNEYILKNNLDINSIFRKYMKDYQKLIEFFKSSNASCEGLQKDVLKLLVKHDSLEAIARLSQIYLEEDEIELSILYQNKLLNSKYGKKYKQKLIDIYQNNDLEQEPEYLAQVGMELYKGEIIEKNIEKSMEILELAKEKGSLLAPNYLSLIKASNEAQVIITKQKIAEKDKFIKEILDLFEIKFAGSENLQQIKASLTQYMKNNRSNFAKDLLLAMGVEVTGDETIQEIKILIDKFMENKKQEAILEFLQSSIEKYKN